MKIQKSLWAMPPIEADVVYTPNWLAEDIVKWCSPCGKCLDPCKGDGAFYKYLPPHSDWCEIELGKDFFDYDDTVDWIVGNPPYSIFEDWLIHSFFLSSNVVYILPTDKVFQRMLIMDMINKWGGIYGMRIYGGGKSLGFPFGFSFGAFHFKKDWGGKTKIDLVTWRL